MLKNSHIIKIVQNTNWVEDGPVSSQPLITNIIKWEIWDRVGNGLEILLSFYLHYPLWHFSLSEQEINWLYLLLLNNTLLILMQKNIMFRVKKLLLAKLELSNLLLIMAPIPLTTIENFCCIWQQISENNFFI